MDDLMSDVFESDDDPVVPPVAREALPFMPAVPERFPETRLVVQEWLSSVRALLDLVAASQDDLEPSTADTELVEELTRDIRPVSLHEVIEDNIHAELERVGERLTPDSAATYAEFIAEAPANLRKRRLPCAFQHVDDATERNKDSEANLIRRWRKATRLKSLALVHDCNSTVFSRAFNPQNALKNVHPTRRWMRARDTTPRGTPAQPPPLPPIRLPTDTVVTVTFFHSVRGMKVSELDVLGSQSFVRLRDAFACEEDYNLRPFCKGACFLIDGAFYSDTRIPDVPDYGKWIADYMQKQSSKRPMCTPMEDVRVDSAPVVINKKSAFLHQGDCEHRVVFSAVRTFDPRHDEPRTELYPLRVFEPGLKMAPCEVCTVAAARKTIFNACLLPRNPMKLCQACMSAILFKADGVTRVENDDFIEIDYRDVV